VPLDQLLRALPVVLLLGTIPGLAVVTLIDPRLPWVQRFAAAPGFSAGIVGVTGLVFGLVHVGFMPVTVLPVLLVLVAAAVVRHLRLPGSARPAGGDRPGPGWAVAGAGLIAGLVLAGITFTEMRGDALPPSTDPAVHGAVAAAIVQDRDVLPVVPVPVTGSGFVRTQAAFEATDALASELGAGGPANVMRPLALVSLLLLPLSVGLLAWRAVPDARVAALASLLCLGLIFPARWVAYGDYPYLVDSTLVVPLILAVACCLEGRSTAASAVMAGAAVLAIWVIHGLEIPTAVVIGGPLWVAILLQRRRAALAGAGAVLAAVAVGAAAGYLLTRSPVLAAGQVSGPQVDEGAGYLAVLRFRDLDAIRVSLPWTLSVLSALLLCAGWVVLVRERRARWLVGSLLLPGLCILDLAGPQLLRPIWSRVYPWGSLDRLSGMEFFVIPVIAAVGTVGLAGLASRLARRADPASPRREKGWSTSVIAIIGAGGLVAGAAGTAGFMSSDLSTQLRISAQDVSVIQALAAKLPAGGAVILNDGTFDAGQWITALTHDVEAEPKSYSASYPDDWRLVAMSQACSDPAGAELALDGMRAVFVGPRSGGPVDTHPWSAACIAALPDLRLVAGSVTGPAGFVVTR
jgi:hypothetical protein